MLGPEFQVASGQVPFFYTRGCDALLEQDRRDSDGRSCVTVSIPHWPHAVTCLHANYMQGSSVTSNAILGR